ncbi:MAG TPA: proton-conducting transporter membrane subunit, partial [Gemmatimonadaceae bacterium]|nr:proton-conducting transporter membrane subunit [Gemmatimonadaceae bacterium]
MIAVFFIGVALIFAGAAAAWALRRRPAADRIFGVLVIGGCLTSGAAAIAVLVSGARVAVTVPSSVPGGDWVFALDPLAAVFVATIAFVGAACVAFGTAHLAPDRAGRPVWYAHLVFAVLIAALELVVTAQSVVPFLIAWELMAVGSYLIIVYEDEKADARRAGLIYIIATHTGTLALFAMFAAWGAYAPDWSFTALANAAPQLPSGGGVILALAVFGFGFKAGFFPFHFWLPPAHSSAPTHVSALLSGVVIKTGIYGILRVVSMLGGAPPRWWGWAMLVLGVGSGVLGVLWALAQHDVKRLLAYHSVENIGIIGIGIGVGSLGSAYGYPGIAVIGYAGALLHTVNRALFKSLLFLGAGAVYHATGTRDMEALGGLAKRVPYTWVAFFIGATAIIGVPPLNGFVSEWIVYVGLFQAAQTADALRLAALGVPALALIGALALACFVKVSGVVFLGHPRTAAAAGAHEVSRALLVPMFVLCGACVLLGVAPAFGVLPVVDVAAAIARASPTVVDGATAVVRDTAWVSVVALALLATLAVGWLVRRQVLRRRSVRLADTWACGYALPSP